MKAFNNSNTYGIVLSYKQNNPNPNPDPNRKNLIEFLLDHNPPTVQILNYDCFHIQRHNKMYELNGRASFATTCSSKSISCPYIITQNVISNDSGFVVNLNEMDIIDNFLAISIYFTIPTEIFLSRTNLAHLYS